MRLACGALILLAMIAATRAEAEPRFRADGKDADLYGRREGYAACTGFAYMRELRCRVGAFSHFDTLFPARTIRAPDSPAPLARAEHEPAVRYNWAGEHRSIDRYLDSHPVTAFLIARGATILVERYQYARRDTDRLASFSMAKTVIALLIGIAVADGAIASIDLPAETYVPDLNGTEYGRTSIKALLQMASGVAYHEGNGEETTDVTTLATLTLGQDPGGSVAALKRFNTRVAEPGARFNYASGDTLVLGLVLSGATGRRVADYAREKLWAPLGAEADASWIIDATGNEITFAYMNAILRDWARLGLMLAHDGAWNGHQVVPRDWLMAMTTIGPDSPFWAPGMTLGAPAPGYGYQTVLLLAKQRQFALRGLRGQRVLVDPATKTVLVQTALYDGSEAELYALWAAVVEQGR